MALKLNSTNALNPSINGRVYDNTGQSGANGTWTRGPKLNRCTEHSVHTARCAEDEMVQGRGIREQDGERRRGWAR